MQNSACNDDRSRGMFQFYGANRTGRWAGRLIQLQNLPQNHMEDLAEARNLVRLGDFESLSLLYDDIPDTLSQLIRTAFIAKPGYKFYVSDFSAIEARVIAHLAEESWRAEVFKNGVDMPRDTTMNVIGIREYVQDRGVLGNLSTLQCK